MGEKVQISDKTKLEKKKASMENSLIEAKYHLTLEEQRLILATIALLDSIEIAPNGFPLLKIPVKLIVEKLGLGKNYHIVKISLERLMSKPIKIETIDEDGRRQIEIYNWFAKGRYKEGKGFIEVQFHPDLKPYLLELKERFTSVPLEQILKLRSKYSSRLYQLLKRYENTGQRIDKLEDLREKLGVEPHEYKRFEAFERKVLRPAVKEISEKTDIEVSYVKKKTGRKISHIEFSISLKKTSKSQEIPQKFETIWEEIGNLRDVYKETIERVLREIKGSFHKFTENQVLFFLINADKEIFDDYFISEVIIKASKNKRLKNPIGYLIHTFNIDVKNAKFKELLLTDRKIDKELLEKKLKENFFENKRPTEIIKMLWNEVVKTTMDRNTASLVKEPLKNAVFDEKKNKLLIPVPDEVYKEWFEQNILPAFEDFLDGEIKEIEVLILEE